jgi:hypothetical protein
MFDALISFVGHQEFASFRAEVFLEYTNKARF